MGKKIWTLVNVVILCALIGLFGCVSKGKQAQKKEKTPTSIEVVAVSTKGWKTYVSKAGFSVTYPAEWYLEENIGSEMPRYQEGWVAFDLYDPRDQKIGMFFTMEEEIVLLSNIVNRKDIPKEPDKRIIFIIKNNLMRTVKKIRQYNKNNINYVEVYGIPRGLTKEQYVTFFYSRNKENIIQINSGEKGIEDLLEVMRIETK